MGRAAGIRLSSGSGSVKRGDVQVPSGVGGVAPAVNCTTLSFVRGASRIGRFGVVSLVGLCACVSEPDYTGRLCSGLDPCPEGWICGAAGTCAPQGASVDGGGADAAAQDARPPDVGPLDAGPTDAGLEDAGLEDAEPADLGVDAGPPDSGPSDAGPGDAGDPRLARCADPVEYPGQGWQVRFYDLPNLPEPTFGACLGVDDIAGAGLDQFFGASEGPSPGVLDFGAIWTARRTFDEGVWTLVLDHDDGVRVYIDGQLVYEDWDHGREAQATALTQYLTAGAHDIRIEHFDDDGEALLRFGGEHGCTRLEVPTTGWIVTYHGLTGADDIVPELCYGAETLTGPGIDLDHGLSAPAPVIAQGVDDDFAIIARTQRIMRGRTRFDALFDDGLRVFVGGTPVIDVWQDGTTRSRQATLHTLGMQQIQVEKYDEADQSRLRLGFDAVCDLPPASTSGVWFAAYYPVTYTTNPETWTLDRGNCLGAEVVTSNGLDWGSIPPVVSGAGYQSLWGAEYFGNRTFATSATVNVTHDDGLRVWSGSSLLYEDWTAPLVRTAQFTIPPGNHDLRLEYFENQGGEQLRVSW